MAGSTFDARKSAAILRGALRGRMPAVLEGLRARAVRECPRRSGRLAASIEAQPDPDGLGGRVGTNLLYGRVRCLGSRRAAPDDFLTRALAGYGPEAERAARGG